MLVRAIKMQWDTLAVDIAPFVSESQTCVTPGVEYVVHSLSIYKSVVFILIIDDAKIPVFLPSPLFEMVRSDMPTDWICNLVAECGVEMIIGPEFIAKDLVSYNRLIDQEPDQITKLWNSIT